MAINGKYNLTQRRIVVKLYDANSNIRRVRTRLKHYLKEKEQLEKELIEAMKWHTKCVFAKTAIVIA